MDAENQERVRRMWTSLEPGAAEMAATFYDRLFETDAEVAELFSSTDMRRQTSKFADMLAEIVRVMDDPERLVSETAASGRRHVAYGARDRDYDTIGAALLWALERHSPRGLLPEDREAWREIYSVVAGVMRRAAAKSASRADQVSRG
jgi:hemoglobin-like flavoprotein